MVKKISKIPFNGTTEQEARLRQVIADAAGDQSKLMMVMQGAQDIYGYLPYEVQKMIAEGLDVPMEKVYGTSCVPTFICGMTIFWQQILKSGVTSYSN